jgi:hypothetical protein
MITELCQEINLKLVQLIATSGYARFKRKTKEARAKIMFQYKIFEWVQQKNIGSLITPELADNIGNRTALVALIQVLEIEMQNRIANSLNHLAEQKHIKQVGIQRMPSSDVNQMFPLDGMCGILERC